jgi:hypothetical protein
MTTFGWDMSHFDAPDPGNAVAQGIRFFTHKAGGDRDDPEINAWWRAVRDLAPDKVLLGAYWVLYPGNPTGRADAFITRLDVTCPGWRDRPFLLQVDCEKWNGDSSTVPSRSEIQTFCNRLVARFPRLRPIVYGPKWVYGDALAGLSYPLWASSYVSGTGSPASLYPGDSSSGWKSYSGQKPAILQFTSSATIGGQSTCDANAYRGTLADLIALAAPGWSTDMDLTPENLKAIASAVWGNDVDPSTGGYTASGALWTVLGRTDPLADVNTFAQTLANANRVDVQALAASLTPALVTGVLTGLTPEIVASIPTGLAQQVVDLFAARLAIALPVITVPPSN